MAKEYFIFNVEDQLGKGILFHMTPEQIQESIENGDAKIVSFGPGDTREDILDAFRCYDDYLKPKAVFARKCDCCGKGMDSGFVLESIATQYICEDCDKAGETDRLIKAAGYESSEWEMDGETHHNTAREEAFEDDFVYWTEWQDEVAYLQVGENETDLVEDTNAW